MHLFQTNRMRVTYLEERDLRAFYDMQSNINVMQFIKPKMNWEESRNELNRFVNYYTDPNINFHIWALRELRSEQLIGICGIYENTKNEYEIAYRLREKFWGVGYGQEIASGLIKYGFEQMDLNKLVAYAREGNIGSIRILEKVMLHEGVLTIEGGYKDRFYSLEREDWLEG